MINWLLEGHVKNCPVTFRMEPCIFKVVATYLRRTGLICGTRIKVEEKLGFLLYMLSHNSTYENLQVKFGHNNDTSYPHINHFLRKAPLLHKWFSKAVFFYFLRRLFQPPQSQGHCYSSIFRCCWTTASVNQLTEVIFIMQPPRLIKYPLK